VVAIIKTSAKNNRSFYYTKMCDALAFIVKRKKRRLEIKSKMKCQSQRVRLNAKRTKLKAKENKRFLFAIKRKL